MTHATSFPGRIEIQEDLVQLAKHLRLQRMQEVRKQEQALSKLRCQSYRETVERRKSDKLEKAKDDKRQVHSKEQAKLLCQWQTTLLESGEGHRSAGVAQHSLREKALKDSRRTKFREYQVSKRALAALELVHRQREPLAVQRQLQDNLRDLKKDSRQSAREDAHLYGEQQKLKQQKLLAQQRAAEALAREKAVHRHHSDILERITQSAEQVDHRFPVHVHARITRHGPTDSEAVRNQAAVQGEKVIKQQWQAILNEMKSKTVIATRARKAKEVVAKHKGVEFLEEELKLLAAMDRSGERVGRIKEANQVVQNDVSAQRWLHQSFENIFMSSATATATATATADIESVPSRPRSAPMNETPRFAPTKYGVQELQRQQEQQLRLHPAHHRPATAAAHATCNQDESTDFDESDYMGNRAVQQLSESYSHDDYLEDQSDHESVDSHSSRSSTSCAYDLSDDFYEDHHRDYQTGNTASRNTDKDLPMMSWTPWEDRNPPRHPSMGKHTNTDEESFSSPDTSLLDVQEDFQRSNAVSAKNEIHSEDITANQRAVSQRKVAFVPVGGSAPLSTVSSQKVSGTPSLKAVTEARTVPAVPVSVPSETERSVPAHSVSLASKQFVTVTVPTATSAPDSPEVDNQTQTVPVSIAEPRVPLIPPAPPLSPVLEFNDSSMSGLLEEPEHPADVSQSNSLAVQKESNSLKESFQANIELNRQETVQTRPLSVSSRSHSSTSMTMTPRTASTSNSSSMDSHQSPYHSLQSTSASSIDLDNHSVSSLSQFSTQSHHSHDEEPVLTAHIVDPQLSRMAEERELLMKNFQAEKLRVQQIKREREERWKQLDMEERQRKDSLMRYQQQLLNQATSVSTKEILVSDNGSVSSSSSSEFPFTISAVNATNSLRQSNAMADVSVAAGAQLPSVSMQNRSVLASSSVTGADKLIALSTGSSSSSSISSSSSSSSSSGSLRPGMNVTGYQTGAKSAQSEPLPVLASSHGAAPFATNTLLREGSGVASQLQARASPPARPITSSYYDQLFEDSSDEERNISSEMNSSYLPSSGLDSNSRTPPHSHALDSYLPSSDSSPESIAFQSLPITPAEGTTSSSYYHTHRHDRLEGSDSSTSNQQALGHYHQVSNVAVATSSAVPLPQTQQQQSQSYRDSASVLLETQQELQAMRKSLHAAMSFPVGSLIPSTVSTVPVAAPLTESRVEVAQHSTRFLHTGHWLSAFNNDISSDDSSANREELSQPAAVPAAAPGVSSYRGSLSSQLHDLQLSTGSLPATAMSVDDDDDESDESLLLSPDQHYPSAVLNQGHYVRYNQSGTPSREMVSQYAMDSTHSLSLSSPAGQDRRITANNRLFFLDSSSHSQQPPSAESQPRTAARRHPQHIYYESSDSDSRHHYM